MPFGVYKFIEMRRIICPYNTKEKLLAEEYIFPSY